MIRFESSRRVRPVFAVLAIAAAFWTMCVWHMDFNGLYTPDSAEFSILAKSIAAGAGYRDVSQPNFPHHTKYPFGYPLLLSPAAAVFGDSGPAFILACKAITAVLGVLTLLGAYFFFKPYLSAGYLFALLLFCAINPVMLVYSSNVMSEVPLACFCIWGLILIRSIDADISLESVRSAMREIGRTSIVMVGLLWLLFLMALPIAAAYYVRGNGIVLLPMAGLYFLVKRGPDPFWFRCAKAGALTALVALLVLPWVHRDVTLARAGQTSGENYVSQILTPFENPFKRKLTGELFARRLQMNAHYYSQVIAGHLFPAGNEDYSGMHSHAPFRIRFGLFGFVVLLKYLIFGGLILGFALHLKMRGPDFAALFPVFFVGLLMAFTYRQHRYLIPLIPFGYYFLLTAVAEVRALITGRRGVSKAASHLWTGTAVAALLGIFALNVETCRGEINFVAADDADVLKVAGFIETSTPEGTAISGAPYYYIFSNRLCVPFDPKSMALEAFEDHLAAFGIELILAEKWAENVSDFDLLMHSSINYDFQNLGSVAGLDFYRATKRPSGKLFRKKKQKDFSSIVKLLESRGLDPHDTESWNMLGYAYYQMDEYPKAIEAFKRVVSANVQDHVAHFNLGSAYMGNGEYALAMAEFESVRSAEFGYTIQNVLNRNVAILRLTQAIEVDPRSPGVETMHYEVAQLWYNSGVYRKAVEELKAAIQANPEWLDPRFFLALNYEAMGEVEKAEKVYREMLKKNPSNTAASEKIKFLKASSK